MPSPNTTFKKKSDRDWDRDRVSKNDRMEILQYYQKEEIHKISYSWYKDCINKML